MTNFGKWDSAATSEKPQSINYQDAQQDEVLEVLSADTPARLLQGNVLSHIAHGTAPSQSPYPPGTSAMTKKQRYKTR